MPNISFTNGPGGEFEVAVKPGSSIEAISTAIKEAALQHDVEVKEITAITVKYTNT